MYQHLGAIVSRHWRLVILAWALAAAVLWWAAPAWDTITNDGDLAYLPERMTTVRGEALLARAFPDQHARSQAAVVLARRDRALNDDDLRVAQQLAARFAPDGEHRLPIVQTWSPSSDIVGEKLISTDRRAALVVLLLSGEFMAVGNIEVLEALQQSVEQLRLAADFPAGLQLGVTGSAAIGGDMLSAARESIRRTELVTALLVLLILLAVYRAPLLAVVPLTAIVASVFVSVRLLALLTQVNELPGFEWLNFQIFKTTRIFIVTLLFGSGTDFCLFLIARYREQFERGLGQAQALAAASAGVGNALVASALTTVAGLAMMVFADFGKFRNSGPAIGLCLLVTLAACLTLAPALLRLFGSAVFWPWTVAAGSAGGQTPALPGSGRRFTGFWQSLAAQILARPGLILVASVALMSPLAWQGLSVPISYNLLAELDDHRPSVRGTALLHAHFLPGEVGPISILAHHPAGQFDTDEGQKKIARLTAQLYKVPGVKAVRSIAEPLGDPPGLANPFSPAGRRKLKIKENPRTKANFLTQVPGLVGTVTRLDVVSQYDPFSRDAVALLAALEGELQRLAADRQSPWFGTSFDLVGTTPGIRDLAAVTQSDQAVIQRLVVLAVTLVLVLILRRPLICIYLVASVLLSYFVTLGATELLFAWLYPGFEGLDWKVPIFLFVILVAVGQDYNIYLSTRVFEEQRRLGPLPGLREAIVRTGGIITSCGIIMSGTFLSMVTGSLRGMQELGFALSLGIALDTFVVRPVLVPAFLALACRRQAAGNLPVDDASHERRLAAAPDNHEPAVKHPRGRPPSVEQTAPTSRR